MSGKPTIRVISDGDGATTKLQVLKTYESGRRRWVDFPKARMADFHFEVGHEVRATVEAYAWSVEMEATLVDLKLIDPRPVDRSGAYVVFGEPYRTRYGRERQQVTVQQRTEAGVDGGLLVTELSVVHIAFSGRVGEFKQITP